MIYKSEQKHMQSDLSSKNSFKDILFWIKTAKANYGYLFIYEY